jgi:hypothetical protein
MRGRSGDRPTVRHRLSASSVGAGTRT